MKTSFVAAVLNEEDTIDLLLNSLLSQVKKVDETIIVDGGSTDATASVISNKKTRLKFIIRKGNRAVGRNEGVKKATGDIILISDAGCILDKNWARNMIEPFNDSKVDVVAGYYRAKANSIFQKCLAPYVLVMPDRVNSQNFLPATRSVAFRKSFLERIGGFDERCSHNEDYVLAKKVQESGAKMVFKKDAIVYWLPRKNIKEAFAMFFRFSYGDMQVHILRPKVIILLTRYLIAATLFVLFLVSKSPALLYLLIFSFLLYVFLSIGKNYRYVKDIRAIYLLPILQFTSDAAVIGGTILGFISSIWDIRRKR